MKDKIGLRYKRVKQISYNANSIKNLILRQRFAILLVKKMQNTKRIINIDETWLGMEDFTRMKWQIPETTNSVAKKLVQPRISMIVAIDNFGETFMSIN